MNDDNAVLADTNVEALSEAIVRTFVDRDYRERKVAAGLRFAEATRWEDESAKVAETLLPYLGSA